VEAFFTSPHLVDCILVLTACEGAVLIWWHRKTGRGLPGPALVMLLLPGCCLMLALRAALASVAWPWVPVALVGALATHLVDVRLRQRR
jgi:hypothetical protein